MKLSLQVVFNGYGNMAKFCWTPCMQRKDKGGRSREYSKALIKRDKMSALVERITSLNESLNKFDDKRTDERTRIEDEIKKTDAEIDELVYRIYGINETEKRVIENSLR